MKKLHLIRHAKSSWKNPGMEDFDRPLNKRGKIAAPFMGEKMLEKGFAPDLVLSSNAKRAIRTAQLIAEQMNYPIDNIIEIETIYEARVDQLLNVVCAITDDKKEVFLVGHNPGITDFSNYLAGENISNVPTCGIVSLIFPFDSWKMVSRQTAMLLQFDYPKQYGPEY